MKRCSVSMILEKELRWHPDSNWGMEALQASALPLGDATLKKRAGCRFQVRHEKYM